jgi:hypothetical protein
LRLAVVSGLSLPSDDPNAALAAKAVEGVCAAQLSPGVRGAFVDANTYFKRNACAVLAKQPSPPVECAPQPAAAAAAPAAKTPAPAAPAAKTPAPAAPKTK